MKGAAIVTTVVGSYPQPGWLIDRDRLGDRLPPRVRARELWRVPEPFLEEAQDDATRLAVEDMERAGVDVITDGEMRRESYSNRFATALEGVDLDRPGVALDRTGHENPVPRVVGPIRRSRPVEVRDVEFLRSLTSRRIKITVPGPFTMTQQAQNDYYDDERSLALAYAGAVNDELRDLKAAGADIVQIDEPYLQARPERAREYAVEAIDRALDGIEGDTVLHTCFGYAHVVKDKGRVTGYPFLMELNACAATHVSIESAQPRLDFGILRDLPDKTIVLGVLDLGSDEAETADEVSPSAFEQALEILPRERLVAAPDCGMKYLSRELAVRKLEALVAGSARAGRKTQVDASDAMASRGARRGARPRPRRRCDGTPDLHGVLPPAADRREATEQQRFFLDLLLVAIAEHGLMPSNVAARMTLAADPAALQGAVAAGLLGAGPVILGTSGECARLLRIRRGAVRTGSRHPRSGRPGTRVRPSRPPTGRSACRAHPRSCRRARRERPERRACPGAARRGRRVVGQAVAAERCDGDRSRAARSRLHGRRGEAVPILARTAGLLAHLAEEREQPIGLHLGRAAEDAVE